MGNSPRPDKKAFEMKLISFSLYGIEKIYSCGAIENARLAREIFPGWTVVFFVGKSVPEQILTKLTELGSEIFLVDEHESPLAMFWRFRAAQIPGVSQIIFRDTDSRVSRREKVAVDEWSESGKALHIIRDHPSHGIPILGGMWGIQGLEAIATLSDALANGAGDFNDAYGADQVFLERRIYPLLLADSFVHDSFYKFEKFSQGLPPRSHGEFIGERIDCAGVPEFSARSHLQVVESSWIRMRLIRLVARIRIVNNLVLELKPFSGHLALHPVQKRPDTPEPPQRN